jgi:hypothetical protein
MNYFVDGQKLNLPYTKKPFGQGSEGYVYKIGTMTYKIYFQDKLVEEYGHKHGFHSYLMGLNTKQISLPQALIFNELGDYVGYSAKLVPGDQKDRTGLTKIPTEDLLHNLTILEQDISTLSNNYVLMADLIPINSLLDKNTNTLNIIDPGRYHNYSKNSRPNVSIYEENMEQFDHLIDLLLLDDFLKEKPLGTSKKKLLHLRHYLEAKKGFQNYPEFFTKELKNQPNINEYVKTLGRYIK